MITPQPAMGSALDEPTLAVEPAAAPLGTGPATSAEPAASLGTAVVPTASAAPPAAPSATARSSAQQRENAPDITNPFAHKAPKGDAARTASTPTVKPPLPAASASPSAKPGVAGSNATQGAAWQLGGGVGGWQHGDLCAMNVK